MVGHSKWSKVKHIKGSLGVKHGAVFRRPVKEITVAANISDGDSPGNFRLSSAVETTPDQNIPPENIERDDRKQHVHFNYDTSEEIFARLDA